MGAHIPPAYGDIPDSGDRQERASSQDSTDQPQVSPHHTRVEMNNFSQPDPNKEHGIMTPNSVDRMTEFDSEETAQEEISNTHPLTQPSSPAFSSGYIPKYDENNTIHSQELSGGDVIPRSKLPYKEPIPSPPYYEPNAEKQVHSPSAYHRDVENSSTRADHAGASSASYYDSHRGSQPSSPRQYQSNSGMGMPYHHAPITVASARTHALPLLMNEKTEASYDSHNRSYLGSAVSLTSSSADESSEPERNRDSRKIEV